MSKKWKISDPVPTGSEAPSYYDLTDEAKTRVLGKHVNNKLAYPIRPEAKRGKMFVFGKMTIIFTPELYSKAIDLAIWEGYLLKDADIEAAVETMLLQWAKAGGADPGREWSLENDRLANKWAKFGEGKGKEQRLATNATPDQRAKISRAIEDTLKEE